MTILLAHHRTTGSTGLLGKLASGLIAATVLLVGLAFSVIGLAVAGVLALVLGVVVWWKLRALRRAMAEASSTVNRATEAKTGTAPGMHAGTTHGSPADAHHAAQTRDGLIIDGECVREDRPAR